MSSTHLILPWTLERKDGHHPADQVTWKHCTHRSTSNGATAPKAAHKSRTPGNGTAGRETKCSDWLYLSQAPPADTTAGCCSSASTAAKPAVPCCSPSEQKEPGQPRPGRCCEPGEPFPTSSANAQGQRGRSRRGDKGQMSKGCPDCTLPGQALRVVRHVRSGSNRCSTWNKDTNSQAQQPMPHHSNYHKWQMPTVWFLLSISIWKVPLIMCQYSSITFDWACTEILVFSSVLNRLFQETVSRCGQALGAAVPHQLSVSLLWWVSKVDCVTPQAASSLCERLAGAPAFFLDRFTSHGDGKGEGRSLT